MSVVSSNAPKDSPLSQNTASAEGAARADDRARTLSQDTTSAEGAGRADDRADTFGVWHRLRARLAARQDSEHEQVLIRIGFAIAIQLGLLVASAYLGDEAPSAIGPCLLIAAAYVVGSVALFGHLLWRPKINPVRRYAGMVLDLGTLPVGMIVGDWLVAPLYPMFLWTTLGMGLRYGRRYLLVAAVASVVGFALVVVLTEYWRSQWAFSLTLGLALIVLPAYVLTLLTKLTAAVERAEEASQAKSRFLATMSHELRTPLHAIIGMSDLLHRTHLGGEQQEMVRTVRSAGQSLLGMIDELLDVARIESGRALVESSDFDPDAVVATVRAMLHHQAHAQGLALRIRLDPALPHRLHGAARSLQQVLVNLAGNAIKFTERGSVTIHLGVGSRESERVVVRIVVEDTGIGIAEASLTRIFEPFTQLDDSAARRRGGAGLGLAIVRQLVGLMDGTMTVDSDAGMGTRFVVELPFGDRTGNAPAPACRGRLVLLGERAHTRVWRERLWAPGVEVLEAAHPAAAAGLVHEASDARAVVVIGTAPGTGTEVLLDDLAARLAAEPVSLLVIGDPGPRGERHCLMALRFDCSDAMLRRALHAAFATPLVAAETVPAPISPRSSQRILVAEDNRTNQKVIDRMLKSGGHRPVIVDDGEQALAALEADRFDVVLVDLNMPLVSGLEMLALHRFATGGRDGTPFVALSADATEETRRACEEAGFDAYLTKPVEVDHLLAAIDRVTELRVRAAAPVAPEPRAFPVPRAVDAPSTDDGPPVLDPQYLARLHQLGTDDDFLAEVIHDFLLDGEQLLAELAAAAAAADASTFRDRAHALRSSAAHLGAKALFQLCLGWRGMDPGELQVHGPQHAARLVAEFERLRAALSQVLVERPISEPSVSPQRH